MQIPAAHAMSLRGWRLATPAFTLGTMLCGAWAVRLHGRVRLLSRCVRVNSPPPGPRLQLLAEMGPVPRAECGVLGEAEEPHLCTGALGPRGSPGAAEHPPRTHPCASWSRGRRDRRELGLGASCGPQVGRVAPQLDLGSHSCSSGLLTGVLSCWQEGE